MSDWAGLIRRYRKAHGLTQAAFAEAIGVEQATISRWERGFHVPDLGIQRRLRDLLSRTVAVSDSLIFHRVQCSVSAMKIADKNAKNCAASLAAARLHGVAVSLLSQLDYRPFHTDVLMEQWGKASESGFFCGEIASVTVFNPWRPASGDRVRYCEGFWTPAFLSDGDVMLISDWHEIDEITYQSVPEEDRLTVTAMDELLG